MDTLLQNIRVGARSLRHTPAFMVTAVLTLGLGIGLSTAVFTVADALLLRRLPVRAQDQLVVLWGETRDGSFANYPLDLDDAREFARRARSLERVAFFAYEGAQYHLVRDKGGKVSRIRRSLVSGDFFDVLGARPALGRTLRADDDERGAAPVLVLSHGAWQRAFGGDSAILGRQVVMHEDGVAYTIVGVMPQGLDYPRGTEVWAPIIPSSAPQSLALVGLDLLGRLMPGATPAVARDEMTAFHRRAEAPVWERDLRGVVHTLPRLILGDTRPALIAFAAAAALLLIITCVNVATLLLVRGVNRLREIAVRSALGAGRGRVIGQLLTENALLAVAGGQPRLNAFLLAVFAGTGVALATIGLFGVMATMVRHRTRELGVRMALGATAHDLWRMVMRRGLAIAATGLLVGLLAALATNRLLVGLLYRVSPTDAPTLAVVSGLLLGVALLASAIPARSTLRIDPVIALRADG